MNTPALGSVILYVNDDTPALGSVILYVNDVAASIAFHEKSFGLPLVELCPPMPVT